jgi:enterochelin esterase-like enzyme
MTSRFLYAAFFSLILSGNFTSCKRTKQQEDELYSRHLQRQVKLTIINTPVPNNKSEINLVVFNDGQELGKMEMKKIVDSLYKEEKIEPVVIVGIHAGKRLLEFGVTEKKTANGAGEKADHYDSFLNNELYPYAKKNAGVRKFKSVTIAGFGAGALSALDIAWNHADKISKVGLFSGAFSRKETNIATDTTFTGIMYDKIKSSRKRPKTEFWFYAGQKGNTGIGGDDATDIIANTNTITSLLENKNFTADGDLVYVKGASNDITAWKTVMPAFFQWAIGK